MSEEDLRTLRTIFGRAEWIGAIEEGNEDPGVFVSCWRCAMYYDARRERCEFCEAANSMIDEAAAIREAEEWYGRLG